MPPDIEPAIQSLRQRIEGSSLRWQLLITSACVVLELGLAYWTQITNLGHLHGILGDSLLFFPVMVAVFGLPLAGRLTVVVGAIATGLLLLGPLHIAPHPPMSPFDVVIIMVFWVIVVWVVSIATNARIATADRSDKARAKILNRMLQSEEEERHKLASELHDDTVQCMVASIMMLDLARETAIVPNTIQRIDRARDVLRGSLERTRTVMFEMAPAVLNHHGLGPALDGLARSVGQEMGAEMVIEIQSLRFDPVIEAMMFRTAKEALLNVKRHSHASKVAVTCHVQRSRLILAVIDNGQGFDVEKMKRRAYDSRTYKHIGLPSLIERIELAKGKVVLKSNPKSGTKSGTKLVVSVPAKVRQ